MESLNLLSRVATLYGNQNSNEFYVTEDGLQGVDYTVLLNLAARNGNYSDFKMIFELAQENGRDFDLKEIFWNATRQKHSDCVKTIEFLEANGLELTAQEEIDALTDSVISKNLALFKKFSRSTVISESFIFNQLLAYSKTKEITENLIDIGISNGLEFDCELNQFYPNDSDYSSDIHDIFGNSTMYL